MERTHLPMGMKGRKGEYCERNRRMAPVSGSHGRTTGVNRRGCTAARSLDVRQPDKHQLYSPLSCTTVVSSGATSGRAGSAPTEVRSSASAKRTTAFSVTAAKRLDIPVLGQEELTSENLALPISATVRNRNESTDAAIVREFLIRLFDFH